MRFSNNISPALTGDLHRAEIVISAGRGLVEKDGFLLSVLFAERIDAQLGGTRAAVDLGWIDYSREIGMSGVRISPKLYIGFGVSGTNFHTMGIKGAGTIVAVNNDRNARIFEYADLRIVNDARSVLASLLEDKIVTKPITAESLIRVLQRYCTL